MFSSTPLKTISHFLFGIALSVPLLAGAQTTEADSLLQQASLENVVQYALKHQPLVQQALIDQEITDKVIKGKLADWYPQINFVYNYQRNIELPTNIIGGNPVRFGVNNVSATQINATQALFNRDVLLASSTSSKIKIQAEQNTSRSKMDVVVDVTKAFYDVLATTQQIKIGEEDLVRLQRSLKDAYSQYTAGIVDKTDYKRATILLSNAKANLKTNQELLKYKQEYLKMMMGYPKQNALDIKYDTLQMEAEIGLDTLQQLNYSENIDYKMLFTQRELQKANISYTKWAYIPSVNAFGSYIWNFQNNAFNELYQTTYHNSYVGATLLFPIFQGGKRNARIQEQEWTLKRFDSQMTNLQNSLNTEYARSLASYKSNLATYLALKDNVALAKEVYDVIQLQYKNGVKAYLDVTISETDLRSARINYFNALYQVLASKMDVQRALGQINY